MSVIDRSTKHRDKKPKNGKLEPPYLAISMVQLIISTFVRRIKETNENYFSICI